jgi:hypothetical protein
VNLDAVDLYGRIETLVRSEPQQADAATSGAGVATNHDALVAVAKLANDIERPAETGDLDPEEAHRWMSLLLVIRDHLEPVASRADPGVSSYLAEVVEKLRR